MALDVTQLQAAGTQLDAVIAAWEALLNGTLKGDTGRGISSITKSGETVTVTYTDDTSDTFTVPNGATGNGISSISKSGETLTVNYTNGTTMTFTVPNGATGRGISSITQNPNNLSSATITYTDNTTSELSLPQGEQGDPFTYADFTQEQLAGLVNGVLDAVESTSGFVTAETAQGYVSAHNSASDAHSALFAAKANAADVYTKAEVDAAIEDNVPDVSSQIATHNSASDAHSSLFAAKADAATTYTKTEVDAAIDTAIDAIPTPDVSGQIATHNSASNAHSALFAEKANADDVYTKTEVDSAVGAKYTKPSGGIPSTDMSTAVQASLALANSAVQDVSDKADADNVYTKAEVDAALADKEDSIPAETYDAYGAADTAESNANSYTDTAIANEVSRANAAYATPSSINAVQTQIDALTSKSDVVDVVGTYAELQSYTTSTLLANDVVKVLSDSTHSDGRSYYRWVITNSVGAWEYIGTESVGYTKSETNALLEDKQDTISDLATIRSGAALGATAVQPETGKGLSSNDYTTTEKNKLAGIATGATANSASTSSPLMDGTASVGSAAAYARGDHRHPVDTSRAPAGIVTTGTPTTNTLIKINPSATPKRMPEYFYGTAVTGSGQGISATVTGAQTEDMYINSATGAIYKARLNGSTLVWDCVYTPSDDAAEMIASAWSSATTYTSGDYCRDEGKLWKAKQQNTNSKPVEGADWTQVNVGDDRFRMVLLWENASPTSAFGTQTISVANIANYAKLQILAIGNNNSGVIGRNTQLQSYINTNGGAGCLVVGSKPWIGLRNFVITATGLTFDAASYVGQSAGDSNNWAIPYKIYGIKGGE